MNFPREEKSELARTVISREKEREREIEKGMPVELPIR